MKNGTIALIAVAGLATAVSGQVLPPPPSGATFLMTSSNIVDQVTPQTTISFWAVWTGPNWLFGGANYDMHATDGTFSNEVNVLNPMGQLGTTAGTPMGSNVVGAENAQFHAPPFFFGNPDNPILLATYTWSTTNFTARFVDLTTSNSTGFIVALTENFAGPPIVPAGSTFQLFPQSFTAGSGVIEVTPAPSALALLGLGGLVAVRRRR